MGPAAQAQAQAQVAAAQAAALGAQHATPTQAGPPLGAAGAPCRTEAASAGAGAPRAATPPTLAPAPAEPRHPAAPAASGRRFRRPSGRAPAGKVWNALLGQWDSAEGALGAPEPLAPRGAPRAVQGPPAPAAAAAAAAATSAAAAPPPAAPAVPPPRGTLRMVLGDCVEGMRQLPSGSVDLVIADPPYNIGVQVRARARVQPQP